MDRIALEQYIANEYGTDGEHLWARNPNFTVYRHNGSKKWFALVMDIPRNRIGLDGDELIDVLNVRCNPLFLGSLMQDGGFYPAYHMNKNSWISAALDNTADDEKIKWLLDASFETAGRK